MKSLNHHAVAVTTKGIALLVLALSPFTSLFAQQAQEPTYIEVRLVDVKGDSRERWEDAISDIRDSNQEAGRPFFHVYQRLRGDMGYTVIQMDPYMNDLPPVTISERMGNRAGGSTDEVTVVTMAVYPELSITGDSVAPPGEYMTVRVRQTSPQNQQAYFDWHANEFTPALRQGGWDDLRVGRVISGGNINRFVKFSYSDSLPADRSAEIDQAGIERFMDLIATEQSMSVVEEDYAYRFRSDLSFTAE